MDASISQAKLEDPNTNNYDTKATPPNKTKLSQTDPNKKIASKKENPEDVSLGDIFGNSSAMPVELIDTFTNLDSKTLPKAIETQNPNPIKDTKTTKEINLQDIQTAYENTKDKTILPSIVKNFANTYQFDKAYEYFQMMDPKDQKSDPNLHLHILINQSSVNIGNLDSIRSILPVINSYKSDGLISQSDYDFYQGLIRIRDGQYNEALSLLQNISDPSYQKFIKSLKKAKSDYNTTQNAPDYYLDGLISLSLMKNGYFSIAKKIALDTLSKNENYILPYQVLAYTNFITNNTEASADYFIKLAEFDRVNKDSYNFLIGVSYFRANKYPESVMYLSQVNNEKVLTDAYRYLILAYEKLGDSTNISRYQQKLLGQIDLSKSDFSNYFYQVSFAPYSQAKKFEIYESNPHLYVLFLQKCQSALASASDQDICDYGRVGFDLIQNTLDTKDIEKILNLAEKYNQEYLYQILGDIYVQTKSDLDQAKLYYTKAMKLSSDTIEKEIIKNKLSAIENPDKQLFSKK